MPSCDVLIVGGGPAGASCAAALTRAGLAVIVMDKSGFPRNKVCAGWITPEVVGAVDLDLTRYAQKYTLQEITEFHTGIMGKPLLETRYTKPVSYGIRRCEFDHYLLQRSGAELRLGVALRSLRRDQGLWTVNETLTAPMLVGAGGHFCPAARHLGADVGSDEIAVTAQEMEFSMDAAQVHSCRIQARAPQLYFCRDLKGYGWCFRKGRFLNIGLGREGEQRLKDKVSEFCAELARQGVIPATLPGRFQGHAYVLYRHAVRRVVDDGVLLIGDAAGLAYTQSGEGIRTAVESGQMAARVITTAGGDYRSARLSPYIDELTARYGRKQRPHENAIAMKCKQAVAPALFANAWFTRQILLKRWFLHAY